VFHGVFLLVFLIVFPELLKLIPMSSLAAILILIGYRLASPNEFIHQYKKGREQIIVFITTILCTIFIDLLVGLFAGVVVKIFMQILSGVSWKDYLNLKIEGDASKGNWKITSPILFLNSFHLFEKLQASMELDSKKIHLDVSEARYMDHTSMDVIESIIIDSKKLGVDVIINWGNLRSIYNK
jgi:MFS superfamily sulfate permease-like transporter